MRITSAILLFCLLPGFVSAQGFATLYSDLDELDHLIEQQRQTQELQQSLLQDLELQFSSSQNILQTSNQTISDLKSISWAQAEYLNSLQEQLRQAELIRQAQLRYQQGLGRGLKLWRAGTVTFAVTSLGFLIWGLSK